ncbi:hypothetical protein AS9A_0675 [Hoyosella subflava DQS3-9A1]|uniref:Uncharacterized protein n=1 Tax=Hoyosella subflava (strain DSM 45089 / JCM 17490 / NBRC 109087 / DQS3-9A1) TaxID=443218 RepID=F6EKF8_HOYSD|nr:hypothetical protein AS9A_0675 [Hoyosella subflava DQS3-9A1]
MATAIPVGQTQWTQNGGVPFTTNNEPAESSRTENLEDRGFEAKPPTETYKVDYRLFLGPEADHRVGWNTIYVQGCDVPDEPDGNNGSIADFGSDLGLDFGSGSLGSIDLLGFLVSSGG